MPSKEVARRGKICIVPVCKAVSADVPDRIFFPVPDNKKDEWLDKVGGDIASIKPNKRLFCCENHFDVNKRTNKILSFVSFIQSLLLLSFDCLYLGKARHCWVRFLQIVRRTNQIGGACLSV